MKNQYDFIIIGTNINAPAIAIADKVTDLMLNE